MKKYQFAVSAATDVDIARICAEAPDGVDVILVSGRPSRETANGALLLLRGSFIERFDHFDRTELAGEILNPEWGFRNVNPCSMDGEVAFSKENKTMTMLTGWRGRPLTHQVIPIALAELEKARQHLHRKRTVTVRYV